jgi:hypothetical protein
MKIIRLIKKCLNETYSKVHIGKHLSDLIQVEIKRRLNCGNACYHSVQNLLSSRLLSKNVKIRMCMGDKTDCNNYRGISLLSTSYKILSNILLSRLSLHVVEIICQCGFRRNRSTTDAGKLSSVQTTRDLSSSAQLHGVS